jgi:ankyrin repeat protein
MNQLSLTHYAWLSISAAVVTVGLKLAAYLFTGSVGLLSDARVFGQLELSRRGSGDVSHCCMMKLNQFCLIFLTTLFLLGCAASPQSTADTPQITATISQADGVTISTPDTSTPILATAPVATTSTEVPRSPTPSTTAGPTPKPRDVSTHLLAVTDSQGQHILLVDSAGGVIAQIEAGAAPWGLAHAGNQLYVATAEGIAVIDLNRRERLALVPYQSDIGPPQYGEYRPGGMGIAAAPDGGQVYVGVYVPGQPSRLEILDTESLTMMSSVPVGTRPFDVLVSADGREVFTIDHDSYSVTAVDPVTLETRTLNVAPLGRGAFDKPHYAALAADGQLWLPFQGQVLVRLDPAKGQIDPFSLTANTHQHGVASTPDGHQVLIVGTGAAGRASGESSLTIFDTRTMKEEILPLARSHEDITVSPDGHYAYLTGGYLLGEGWQGLTVVDLQQRTFSELSITGYPLDIVALPLRETAGDKEVDVKQLNTALIAAARQGDAAAVKSLLSRGASVHASDERGVTALIAAAYQNHVEVAKLLIEAGADVNVKDDTQQSAYLIPTADGYLEMLNLTLEAGADVHSLDSYNGTGLIRAADRGHVKIIEELLKTDIDIDHVNRLGWTALLEAIILGDGGPRHTAVVCLLVKAGVDVNLADGNGVTPLAHARQRGFEEIIAILETAGAR